MNKSVAFNYLLFVFLIGCFIRALPAILSYPFPVGYDSINYYLPVLFHIENNWNDLLKSFPVYTILVYLSSLFLFNDLYNTFIFSTIFLYGFFATTIFLISKKIMNQSSNRSLCFTIFVIFQLSVLRMSWDLSRDILALIFFHIFLLVVYYFDAIKLKLNNNNLFLYLLLFLIFFFGIFSDKTIGILLITTSLFFSIILNKKPILVIDIVFLISFIMYFFMFDKATFVSNGTNFVDTLWNPIHDQNSYSRYDIVILFLSLYGILLPFFMAGINRLKKNSIFLKIPLIVILLFTFFGIFVPNYSYLVPERWVILLGIYLSLIAIFGLFSIVDNSALFPKLKNIIICLFLGGFITYGFLFAIMPYGVSFSIPSFFKNQTDFIFPTSMLFNSLEINKNFDLVKSIDWINYNTPQNSIIVGTKHLRGWFDLFLGNERRYEFLEPLLTHSNNRINNTQIFYWLNKLQNSESSNMVISTSAIQNLVPRPIFFIDYVEDKYIYTNSNQNFCQITESKNFIIYKLTSLYPYNKKIQKCNK